MGTQLLAETGGVARRVLATALAESLLMVGRMEFFDLRQPADWLCQWLWAPLIGRQGHQLVIEGAVNVDEFGHRFGGVAVEC